MSRGSGRSSAWLRALRSGRRGRWFKSSRPDQNTKKAVRRVRRTAFSFPRKDLSCSRRRSNKRPRRSQDGPPSTLPAMTGTHDTPPSVLDPRERSRKRSAWCLQPPTPGPLPLPNAHPQARAVDVEHFLGYDRSAGKGGPYSLPEEPFLEGPAAMVSRNAEHLIERPSWGTGGLRTS